MHIEARVGIDLAVGSLIARAVVSSAAHRGPRKRSICSGVVLLLVSGGKRLFAGVWRIGKGNGALYLERRQAHFATATPLFISHGPRNAGGQYPAVDDPADNVPQNPNHRWSRTLDANVMAVQSRLQAVGEFCIKSRRALRQIQAKAELAKADPGVPSGQGPADLLTRICKGFHRAARQLRVRHKGRGTIEMGDEYDVQDLLHSFLVLHFDDVRPEEHTPSYAGGSSRMDFLLKRERIVVEVKRTREGLGAKEVGEQLMIDIARYRAHPDCKLLLCFVYDPEGRIGNPRGLESDLAALATPSARRRNQEGASS